MKRIFVFLSVALILFNSLSCSRQGENVVKIGAILPLTGDGARYGEADRNGFELALSEIEGLNIEILYEDNQGTAKGSVDAFNKLISTYDIPVVTGLMFSSSALAVAPLAERNNVVVFSTTASSPDLTDAGDYFFRNWPSDVYEGGRMAEFTYNELGLRRVAILSVNLDYGVGLTKVFSEQFKKLGGEITAVEYYEQAATDFRTQLTKLWNENIDAIYLPGYYSEIGLILRQAIEIEIETQFLSCVGFDNPKVIEIAGSAANGVIFARPFYNPESDNTIVKNFVDKFKKRYGSEPGIYAAHAYDALRIIAEAIKKGGNSPEEIIEGLYTIKNFSGVTGETSFDVNGDVVKPIQFMKVHNGNFVKY